MYNPDEVECGVSTCNGLLKWYVDGGAGDYVFQSGDLDYHDFDRTREKRCLPLGYHFSGITIFDNQDCDNANRHVLCQCEISEWKI